MNLFAKSRLRLHCLCLAVGLCTPIAAEEPSQRFLTELRARGYGELAIAYLEQLAGRNDLPSSMREVLDLELSSSYRVWAYETDVPELTQQRLDESRRLLEKFTAAHPKHPAIGEALLDWGDMSFDRGLRLLDRAERGIDAEQRAAGMVTARKELFQAKKHFEQAEQRFSQQLAAASIDSALPEDIKESAGKNGASGFDSEKSELGHVKAKFKKAGTDYYIAKTFEAAEPERKTALDDAAKGFQWISEKYGTAEVGLRADLWRAKVAVDLGDVSQALELLEDVMYGEPAKPTGPVPEFAALYAEAAIVQAQIFHKQNGPEAALKMASEWLRNHRSWQAIPGYQGMALEAAKAGVAYAKDAPPDRRTKIREDAMTLLSSVAKVDSEYRREAIRLRQEYSKANAATGSLSSEEQLLLGDSAASQGKWAEAAVAYEAAFKAATGKDASQAALASQRLSLARYRIAAGYYADGKMEEAIQAAGLVTKTNAEDPSAGQAASLAAFAALSIYESSEGAAKDAALDRLKKIVEFTATNWPDQPPADDAQLVLGQVYLSRGETDKAVESFLSVRPGSVRYPNAALGAARIYWKSYLDEKQKPDEQRDEKAAVDLRAKAESTLRAASERDLIGDPDHPSFRQWFECRVLLAEIYLDSQQWSEAASTIAPLVQQCQTTDGDDPDALCMRTLVAGVRAQLGQGDRDKATESAVHLLTTGPDNSYVNSVLVEFVRQLRLEVEEAQAAIAKSKNALELAGVGETQARMSKAQDQLKQLLLPLAERRQFNLAAMSFLADTCGKFRMEEQGLQLCERILERANADPAFAQGGAKTLARVRFQFVGLLTSQGQFESAAKHIESLVETNPRALELLMKKGEVLQAWATKDPKRYDEAVSHWANVRQLLARVQPRPAEYYDVVYNTATCLVEHSVQTKDATKLRQAEQLLKATMALNSKLSGPKAVEEYNALINRIAGLSKK